MSSDDDSLPLGQWKRPAPSQPAPKAEPAPASKQQESDEDALPDWIQHYKSPYTGGYKPAVSDDDDVVDLTGGTPEPSKPQEAKAATKKATGAKGQDATGGRKAASSKAAARRGAAAAPIGASQSHDVTGDAGVAGGSQAGPSKSMFDDAMEEDAKEAPATQPPATQPAQAAGAAGPEPSSAAKAKIAGGVSIAAQLALGKGEVAIVLPERVPRNKALVELASGGPDDHILDLAGDAGAVGRVLVGSKAAAGGGDELQLDLKGVLFSASVLPLAGTAMVVNITATEAKVEMLVNDFVRLMEQRGLWGEDEGEGILRDLIGEDDENYNMPGTQGAGDEGDEDGGGKKKKAKKGEGKGKGAGKGGDKGGKGSRGGGKGGTKKLGAKGGVKKKRAPAKPKKAAAAGGKSKGKAGKGK